MATTTVTICDEVETLIAHPAEYVQKKVRREGISCIFLPHCCTPAWVTFPECYLLQWVKKRDAWEEVVKTYTCEDYELDLEDAFEAWLRNALNPVPGFRILTGDLTELFGLYVQTAYEVADPIPNEYLQDLKRFAKLSDFVFSQQNINDARWLWADHALAQRLWPGSHAAGITPIAITYYNLVIFAERFRDEPYCERLAKWAHELVHVNQYNQMDWENFLQEYLAQGMVQHHDDITLEQEAIHVESLAMADCLTTIGELSPIQQAAVETQRAIRDTLERLVSEGDAVVKDNVVLELSGRGKRILDRLKPKPPPDQVAAYLRARGLLPTPEIERRRPPIRSVVARSARGEEERVIPEDEEEE